MKNLRKLILIAEDDDTGYFYLETVLNMENYDVMWAKNGFEVIEMLEKNSNINLILMDLKMPELNGVEATKRIRLVNTEIPIIAQTAHAFAGDRELAINAGCNDYISKPINRLELLSLIKTHI